MNYIGVVFLIVAVYLFSGTMARYSVNESIFKNCESKQSFTLDDVEYSCRIEKVKGKQVKLDVQPAEKKE